MMTKKDFEIIAAKLKEAKPNPRDFLSEHDLTLCMATWRMSVGAIITGCIQINDRFDREVFKKACGCYD